MKTSVASTVLALACSVLAVSSAGENPIVYYLYFSDDQCVTDLAGVVAKVAGEPWTGVGGLSPSGKCSEEVVCQIDNQSEICQSLNRTNSGVGSILVDDFGVIVECDSSNTDNPVCAPIPDECDTSSIYPNCFFRLRTIDQLKATPDVIQRTAEESQETHAYLMYYEDDQCTDIAVIDSMATKKSLVTSVDASVSCNKAVTCAVEPDGDSCQSISAATKSNSTFDLTATEDGILVCIEDGSCEYAPSGCVKSDILESCYVKWFTPAEFFNDPETSLIEETPPLQLENPDEEEEEVKEASGGLAVTLGSVATALAALFAL